MSICRETVITSFFATRPYNGRSGFTEFFVSLQRDVSQDLQNVLIFSPLPSENTYRYGLSVQLPTLKGIRTVYLSARELRLFAESAPNRNAVLLCHLSQIANQEVSAE